MIKWVKKTWKVASRPSVHYSLGFLTIGGFIAGVIFWGGFNTALEATNSEAFCTGCHEMEDNVFQELKTTIHYTNRSGVRATCPDCHVPHEWTNKIARKMQASKEVWGTIFGTINTREKFLEKRLELAQHGLHGTKRQGRTGTFHLSGQWRKNLYRLPQGHRSPPARYGRCGGLVSFRSTELKLYYRC